MNSMEANENMMYNVSKIEQSIIHCAHYKFEFISVSDEKTLIDLANIPK